MRLLDSLPALALNFGPLIYQLFVRLGSAFASVVLKDPIIAKPRLETMPTVCYLCQLGFEPGFASTDSSLCLIYSEPKLELSFA